VRRRLFGATAWISSTITDRAFASIRARLRAKQHVKRSRRRYQNMGRAARIRSRSATGVSPFYPGADIDIGKPAPAGCSLMPARGASRLRWMSFDSALSGDT
jgi:hypothetical protein